MKHVKNIIPVKLWIFIFLIVLLIGILSTTSSYLYLLDTKNPVSYFVLLQSRIFSYLFWIIFIPIIYFITIILLKEKINVLSIIILITLGLIISAIHRVTVLYINDIIFAEIPSHDFITELINEKFALLSLIYESFFLYVMIIVLILIYRYYYISREAVLKEANYRNQLVNAELSNLKMKFQPHFIFNALHSISAIIYTDPPAADTMITKLSDLLRHSVKKGNINFVTLKEELEIAEKYIEIQKLRFGNRINYDSQIDKTALQQKVPVFILQPLLENCIKHGVELTSSTVLIENVIKISDDTMLIEIKNSVPEKSSSELNKSGEGLNDLVSRLEYLYDNSFSFSANKNSNNEFIVKIKLPFKDEKEDQGNSY